MEANETTNVQLGEAMSSYESLTEVWVRGYRSRDDSKVAALLKATLALATAHESCDLRALCTTCRQVIVIWFLSLQ